MWCIYIVRCSDQSLYTGITTDIARRVREHNGEEGKGAKYTLSKRPVTLVYLETTSTRSLALKREYAMKRLSRQQKEALLNPDTLTTTRVL